MSAEPDADRLVPDAAPAWLRPLLDGVDEVSAAQYRHVPADVRAAFRVASTAATVAGTRRDASVLVLFSGPRDAAGDGLPDDADLLLTVRASTLRNHAGQAAFPGGASDPEDTGPVATALREAEEETGIDVTRLTPLAVLDRIFIPPSGFHVVPVLAYSPDPGPVGVVSPGETAIVARVPVRAFTNPENRLMVYRKERSRRYAGPAFLLNQMLVWGFTGQVISALLDVAGWARPWDTDDVRELDGAMALVRATSGYGEDQR
ncbi:NUDIX hydrolase [Mycolicibacterium grossiae]|uniref:Coenzyme A pyrophosphatase n=1 Tax=Mycolicibacterium grossiae TaxID=1552759 RepID=A0A1E8Q707_9MYCO|nr:CoA pyrophosphatase [Mycolicibacterium grossiae]OFJ53819.1 coenzyme A pyrophosphatase [Mycolicibacterium grossiae]QEM43973.1 CoA pyrophosphatase [Mycolicibacterium grossiae]